MNEDTLDLSPKRFSRWALPLSVLLHILLLTILLNEHLLWVQLPPPREVAVELVPEPPKPPPPAAKAQEAKPVPPKPEPPKPEPPKPQAMPLPQIPPPQLMPGRLAQHSSTPSHLAHNGAGGTSQALAMAPGAAFTLAPKEEQKAGRPGSSAAVGPELTQSEQDFILRQIMKYWTVDFHSPEAHGLVLQGVIYINADGTLASPLNKNDPWDPAVVIADYPSMVRAGYSFRREAVEGFLLALRLCQPLQLPPTGQWPRRMVLKFAFDDL